MVGDLGLGKALDVSSRLTMIAGTPSFVAPEQAQGEHLDARADQYSLAALAYLLLTGRPPYAHGTLSAAANPAPPAPMSTPERPFPPAVEDVVRRGLAVDRDDRFPDVRSFVDALRTALGEDAAGRAARALAARSTPSSPSPGNRPSLVPDAGRPARRRSRRSGAGAGRRPCSRWCCSWPAASAGFVAWQQHARTTSRYTDTQGALSVTVPIGWSRDVSTSGWMPPDSSISHPALSVGDGRTGPASGQGVFVGLMPENKLPRTLPQHPAARSVGKPSASTSGDPAGDRHLDRLPGRGIIEQAVAGQRHRAALGPGAQRRRGDRARRCSSRCRRTGALTGAVLALRLLGRAAVVPVSVVGEPVEQRLEPGPVDGAPGDRHLQRRVRVARARRTTGSSCSGGVGPHRRCR